MRRALLVEKDGRGGGMTTSAGLYSVAVEPILASSLFSRPMSDGYRVNLNKLVDAHDGLFNRVGYAHYLMTGVSPITKAKELDPELCKSLASEVATKATGLDELTKYFNEEERAAQDKVWLHFFGEAAADHSLLLVNAVEETKRGDASKRGGGARGCSILRWGSEMKDDKHVKLLKEMEAGGIAGACSSDMDQDPVIKESLKQLMDGSVVDDFALFNRTEDVKVITQFHKDWRKCVANFGRYRRRKVIRHGKRVNKFVREMKVKEKSDVSSKPWDVIIKRLRGITLSRLAKTRKARVSGGVWLTALQRKMCSMYKESIKATKANLLRLALLSRTANALQPDGKVITDLLTRADITNPSGNSKLDLARFFSSVLYRKILWNDNASNLISLLNGRPINEIKADLREWEAIFSADENCKCNCIESKLKQIANGNDLAYLSDSEVDKLKCHKGNEKNSLITKKGRIVIKRALIKSGAGSKDNDDDDDGYHSSCSEDSCSERSSAASAA